MSLSMPRAKRANQAQLREVVRVVAPAYGWTVAFGEDNDDPILLCHDQRPTTALFLTSASDMRQGQRPWHRALNQLDRRHFTASQETMLLDWLKSGDAPDR